MDDRCIDHGLSNATVQALISIFEQFSKIEKVVLYGSRAKGNYRKGSDIDLAIYAPDMRDNEFAALWNALDSLSIIYKVDCLHADKIENAALKHNINEQGKVFWSPQ